MDLSGLQAMGLLLYLLCYKVDILVGCDIVDQASINPLLVVLARAWLEGKALIFRISV